MFPACAVVDDGIAPGAEMMCSLKFDFSGALPIGDGGESL